MSFYIGADPEAFVGNENGVRSIIGLIGGTKNAPRPLPCGPGFAVQEDNVALEYNIPASPSKELFVSNITTAMDFLGKVLNDRYNLQFVKESAVSFPLDQLRHPAARVFGCDPDFNAWTGKMNSKPKAEDKNLRSCGGHVHIGVVDTPYANLSPEEIIKACDLHLGIGSVILDKGMLRKQLYGKAGAYRKKDYGPEYRTLSNFWIFDKTLMEWVYDGVQRSLDFVMEGGSLEEDADLIQHTINANDVEAAHYLVAKYSLQLA